MINHQSLTVILQLSPRGFELCPLRSQDQALTIELTPHGQSL